MAPHQSKFAPHKPILRYKSRYDTVVAQVCYPGEDRINCDDEPKIQWSRTSNPKKVEGEGGRYAFWRLHCSLGLLGKPILVHEFEADFKVFSFRVLKSCSTRAIAIDVAMKFAAYRRSMVDCLITGDPSIINQKWGCFDCGVSFARGTNIQIMMNHILWVHHYDIEGDST
jgi:hypothetical protein